MLVLHRLDLANEILSLSQVFISIFLSIELSETNGVRRFQS